METLQRGEHLWALLLGVSIPFLFWNLITLQNDLKATSLIVGGAIVSLLWLLLQMGRGTLVCYTPCQLLWLPGLWDPHPKHLGPNQSLEVLI